MYILFQRRQLVCLNCAATRLPKSRIECAARIESVQLKHGHPSECVFSTLYLTQRHASQRSVRYLLWWRLYRAHDNSAVTEQLE